MSQLNFKHGRIPLAQVLDQLLTPADSEETYSIAAQGLSVRQVLPKFEHENVVGVLDESVAPTMWIGNQGKVAAHYDVHRNLACVVSGRRHFKLFPPGQISNLYPGPVLNAPGGVPVSLVDAWEPDLDKFPRYEQAQEHMLEATLEPGDAIYMPSLWWHAVRSLESLNVLVNYWWGGMASHAVSPNDSLLHAMLAIAKLDPAQRDAWKSYFEYYVFQTDARACEHLPEHVRDIATTLTSQQFDNVTEFLSGRLKKQ